MEVVAQFLNLRTIGRLACTNINTRRDLLSTNVGKKYAILIKKYHERYHNRINIVGLVNIICGNFISIGSLLQNVPNRNYRRIRYLACKYGHTQLFKKYYSLYNWVGIDGTYLFAEAVKYTNIDIMITFMIG